MRKFAVFDIDGTLIRWQLYHAISDAFVKLGYVSPDTYQTVKDARMKWKLRTNTFKSYERTLIETYEAELKKISHDEFLAAVNSVFDEYKNQTYTYTRKLIENLKKKGYLLFAISGSQIEIIEKMAGHWGFDEWVGTRYEVSSGKFTGKKTVGSADKAKALNALIEKTGSSLKSSIAVGDSGSDIPMLEMVEQPIAFNPDTELFTSATKNKWQIVIERKNVVYQLEVKNGKYQLA